MIHLYTLPTCPICEMIKEKLMIKGIKYQEHTFDELPKEIETDRAPVLAYNDPMHENHLIYLLTPLAINEWIKEA